MADLELNKIQIDKQIYQIRDNITYDTLSNNIAKLSDNVNSEIADIHEMISDSNTKINNNTTDISLLEKNIASLKELSLDSFTSIGLLSDGNDNTDSLNKWLNNVTDNRYLLVDNGEYSFSGTVTIPSNITLYFIGGSIINNGNFTINNTFIASPYYIFKGTGTYTFNNYNDYAYAEWFDSNIVTTYNYFKHIQLLDRSYDIRSPLIINKSYSIIRGFQKANQQSISTELLLYSTITIGDTESSRNNASRGIELCNVTLRGNPLDVVNTIYANIHDCSFMIHNYDGIRLCNTVTTNITNCFFSYPEKLQTYHGSIHFTPLTTLWNNTISVSTFIQNCIITGDGSQYGRAIWFVESTYSISDLHINEVEIIQFDTAVSLVSNSSTTTYNIEFTNVVCDQIYTTGFYISLPNSTIKMVNCYSVPVSSVSNFVCFNFKNGTFICTNLETFSRLSTIVSLSLGNDCSCSLFGLVITGAYNTLLSGNYSIKQIVNGVISDIKSY